ncbi:MAG TPA: lysozyme inhibitor LprI family protein [Rhizomicrobium sp.]|nr:lysozyme inhibitor LprI family protein [Rhizomicrobium sp.]
MKMIRFRLVAAGACAALLAAAPAAAKDAPLYRTRDCGSLTVQADMNRCAGDNYAAADARLNAVYKASLAALPDGAARKGLRDGERAWIAFRDRTCEESTEGEKGGSIWPMEMSECLQDETDKRIRFLLGTRGCSAGASVCNPH